MLGAGREDALPRAHWEGWVGAGVGGGGDSLLEKPRACPLQSGLLLWLELCSLHARKEEEEEEEEAEEEEEGSLPVRKSI